MEGTGNRWEARDRDGIYLVAPPHSAASMP